MPEPAVLQNMVGGGTVGDILDGWSFQQDASPANPNDPNGGTGSLSVSAVATPTSKYIGDNTADFVHNGISPEPNLGTISGIIGAPTPVLNGVSFSLSPVLSLLNATATAPPTGQQSLSDIITGYVALLAPSITVNYISANTNLYVFPGWSENLWSKLKQLFAIYKLDYTISGYTLTINDIGVRTFDMTNNQSVQIARPGPGAAQSVDMKCYHTTLVSTIGTTQFNYDQNPSVETNTTNYSGTVNNGTATIGSAAKTFGSGTKAYGASATTTGSTAVATGSLVLSHVISTTGLTAGIPYNFRFAVQAQIAGITPAPLTNKGQVKIQYSATWSDGSSAISTVTLSPTTTRSTTTRGGGFSPTGTTGPMPSGATTITFTITFQVSAVGAANYMAGPLGPGQSNVTNSVPDSIFIDAFLFTDGPLVPYFDGNSGTGYVWLGTANNSVSSKTIAAINEFYNAAKDSNASYSVNSGETQVWTVSTPDSFPTFLAQPTQGPSYPILIGQFFVSGQDNLPVTQYNWNLYGGSVSVAVGSVPGTIVITMVGPYMEIPGVPGPYTLSASDGTNTYSALSIAGLGVISTDETVTVQSGANPLTTTEVSVGLFDCPFITDLGTLYDCADWIVQDLGLGVSTLTAVLSTNEVGSFANAIGMIVTSDNEKFRVISATVARGGTQITAVNFTRMGDIDDMLTASLPTLGAYDDLWAGFTLGDWNISPLRTS